MSELSSALGGSAPKHHIVVGDKRYPVLLVTQAVKVAYERALFEKARTSLALIRGMVDKDFYERKVEALVEAHGDGEFSMQSDFGRKSLQKPGGTVLLLSILLGTAVGKPNGDVDITPMPELDVANIVAQAPEEVGAIFRTVIKESFPGVDVEKIATDAGEPAGPKAPAPTGALPLG